MSHLISIEVDSKVAKRIKKLLSTQVEETDDTVDMCQAIQEALDNDDAEED